MPRAGEVALQAQRLILFPAPWGLTSTRQAAPSMPIRLLKPRGREPECSAEDVLSDAALVTVP